MVYTCTATIDINDAKTKAEILLLVEKIANYVKANEPNTLGYIFSTKENDALSLFVIEVYKSKEDFEHIHMQSDLVKEWMALCDQKIKSGDIVITAAMGTSIDRFGFHHR
jgi:quinol monooxygenase YgiN